MAENEDIRRLLTPRREIKASDTFRDTIKDHIRRSASAGHGLKYVWGALTVGAAATVMILLMLPSRLSAKDLLAEAASALRKSSSLEMKVDIRTDSIEIFSNINHQADFIGHDILVHRTDSTTYWYVTKGERTAIRNTDGLYVWLDPYEIGWHYTEDEYDVLGYLNVLMHPEDILESELKALHSEKGTRYDLSMNKDEILLTVHSMPVGDYANPYVLNTSVLESENIRRYVLDAQTHRLKSSSVSMVIDGKEREVLKVTDIDYRPERRSLPAPAAGITFIENPELDTPGIPGLDARETASVFLKALEGWSTEILYKFMNPIDAEKVYRHTFEGAKLLSLGRPFRSGSNPNLIFVPYTLRLKGGYIKNMNLALYSNGKSPWLFDGGL